MNREYSAAVPLTQEESPPRSHLEASSDLGTFLDDLPMNRRHWTVFLVCAVALMFDSLDFQVMGLVAPLLVKEWGIQSQLLGVVFSATVAGMLVGTYAFSTISDRIGRRPAFQITVALFALASFACGFAQDVTQLAVLRFLTGLGIGGFIPVDTAVMTEYMPAKSRGRMIGLLAILFPVGGLVAAWLGSVIIPELGWRPMFLLGVIPAVMILAIRILIPETPRFLLARGRLEEARESIRWIAAGTPFPASLDSQPKSGNLASSSFSILELFSSQYRQRTIVAWSVYFFWCFSYYGIILWLPTLLVKYQGFSLAQVFPFMVGFMVAGIAGRVAVAAIIDRVGRKPILVICGIAAGTFMLIFGQQTGLAGLMVFGYATAFFHDGGFGVMVPYVAELYPTRGRATGIGWAAGAGRIAAILSPLLTGYLVAVDLNWVFLSFAIGYVLCAIVMFSAGTETKGIALEV